MEGLHEKSPLHMFILGSLRLDLGDMSFLETFFFIEAGNHGYFEPAFSIIKFSCPQNPSIECFLQNFLLYLVRMENVLKQLLGHDGTANLSTESHTDVILLGELTVP